MTIRIAQEKDLEDIKNLLFQVNNVHADGRPDIFVHNAKKYTDKEILDQLHDETKIIFAYTDEDDKLIGYAFCQINLHQNMNNLHPIKTLYIDDLCVDEKHRRQHIGKSLMKYAEEWARNNGFYNITLNVWECNPSAKAFYEQMGMSVLKTGMEKIISHTSDKNKNE